MKVRNEFMGCCTKRNDFVGKQIGLDRRDSEALHTIEPIEFANELEERFAIFTTKIAGIYAGRSGKDASHWRALMSAETWFSDQEAVVAGLADSVVGQATTGPTNTVEEPAIPSWQDAARRLVAAAQMEVIHAYAH